MKTSHGVVQGYTGVAAVDGKAQVVVHAQAFGTGQENGLLPGVLKTVRDDFKAIGKTDPLATATVLTDSGYHSEVTLQQVAALKVQALIADTGFRARDPRFAEAYLHKPIRTRTMSAAGTAVFLQARWALNKKTPQIVASRYAFSTAFIRVCHPPPSVRYQASTSASMRSAICSFFSCSAFLGRPRLARSSARPRWAIAPSQNDFTAALSFTS